MDLHRRVVAAIGTGFERHSEEIEKLVPIEVMSSSQLERVDGGDLFHTSDAVSRTHGNYRDNSFVRVSTHIIQL